MREINNRGRPICIITSMITDGIGRHEVLLSMITITKLEENFGKAKPVEDLLRFFISVTKK